MLQATVPACLHNVVAPGCAIGLWGRIQQWSARLYAIHHRFRFAYLHAFHDRGERDLAMHGNGDGLG